MSKNQKDVLVLAAGKLVQVTIGFVTLRLVTELLSEEEVGIYYTLQALLMLLAFTFFNPIGQFYGRHLVHWKEKDNIKNATAIFIMLRLVALPVALLFSVLVYYIFDYYKYFSLVIYLGFITISLFAMLHGVLLSAANVLIGRVAFTIYASATVVCGLIASLSLVQFNKTAISWMLGLFIIQVLFSVFLYSEITKGNSLSLRKIKESINLEYIYKVMTFIAPVTAALFLQWGQSTSFRLVVENLYSVEILAYIAVGMALSGAIFSALESLSTQFYMPIYLKKITNNSRQERTAAWNQIASIMVPIYVAVAIYIIAFAPLLARLLVAEKYHEAYVYTMIGAIVELLRATTNLVYLVSQSEVKTTNTVIPYIFGFSLMIVCLYTIDISNGFWKVPVILATSYLVTLVMMTISMKNLLSIELNWSLIVKSVLMTLPLFLVYFLEVEPTLFESIALLALGGFYIMCSQYYLAKLSIKKMSRE